MGFRYIGGGGSRGVSSLLNFDETQFVGIINSVDTSQIYLTVKQVELMKVLGVGNLIAIKSFSEQKYYIGIIEKVSRNISESLIFEDSEEEGFLEEIPNDVIKLVLVGTYKKVDGVRKNVFKRGTDSFPQIDSECYLITGTNLQNFMSLLSQNIGDSEKLTIGHFLNDQNAKAILDGDKLFQRHASVLGSTGSGKSWCVATILEKASNLNFPNILVFDMHGEYTPLTKGESRIAEGFRIAGPGDLEDGSKNDNLIYIPYWLLNREEMLSMILDRNDLNAPNQASRFTLHIKDLKEETLNINKKDELIRTFTVDSPIPYEINDLLMKLRDDDTQKGVGVNGKPVKGEWEGKLTRFISRLQAKLEDRRYSFMFQPPEITKEYSWLNFLIIKLIGYSTEKKGIKIIDFSEVPSDVLPVVTGTLSRLIYDIQFWNQPENRTPFTLLCDEAHLYLPVKEDANSVERQALENFERIAKEGRKYGVSLFVVSQRPSDVSRTILSQCNNFIILRLTNDRDQNVVKRLMPDSLKGITDCLPLLDIGEALILGDSILLPNRIKLDPPIIKPDSMTKDFWKEWASNKPNNDSINQALESLRAQTRITYEKKLSI